jgi:K+-sensing histidine kinase KdpD
VSVRLLPAGDGVREARIGVCGGSAGLERALACVVDNAAACGRKQVELRALAPLGIDVVAIEVADDGPHFPDDRLARPVVPFDAARPGELEVALYTAERILRASLGSLRRENLDGGGARVSLFFPVVPERTPD